MSYKKLIGSRIRELRKNKNINQEQLAELVGVEPTSVSNIENGRNYPSFNTLEKMVEVLGITFNDIFIFQHHQDIKDLKKEINEIINNNPDRLKDFYKILKALVE